MKFEYAGEGDYQYILSNDKHIAKALIEAKIRAKEIILVRDEVGRTIGWLRFGFFWDCLPFMNLLHLEGSHRRQGIGSKLVQFWEQEMAARGYKLVMTSTLSDEGAQHFYRKLGYRDMGSLLMEGEALEIILSKKI